MVSEVVPKAINPSRFGVFVKPGNLGGPGWVPMLARTFYIIYFNSARCASKNLSPIMAPIDVNLINVSAAVKKNDDVGADD